MLGQIDKTLKPYEERLFLCKPDRTVIAELNEAYDKNIILNYGGVHELTFNIPFKIEKNKKFVRNDHVDILRGHFLIKYEKWDINTNNIIDTQYFIITKPKNSFDNGKEIKQIQCYSQQYELRDKIIRDYSGTKLLSEILNDTLVRKSNWSIGTIENTIATKYRTFDIAQTTLIDLMYELQEKYNAITIWDTVNKTVSFYNIDDLGQDKGLSVEYGKYLKAIGEDPNFDEVITRLYVYGKDGLSINKLNPTGLDYIESFDYYMYPFERDINGNVIEHSNYMSDSLCHAILDYQDLLSTKTGQFSDLLTQKESLQTTLTTKENELANLNTDLTIIQNELDIANATGGNTSQLITDKNNKISEINAKQSEIDQVESDIADVDSQIATLQDEIKTENNFTSEQLIELNGYIHESVWMDNAYTDENDLYEEAKVRLSKLSQPLISYEIDIVDFLKVVRSQRDWDKLILGDIITIKYTNFNIDIKAKIISIEHDIDGHGLKLKIANTTDLKNGFLKMKDALKQSVSTSTQVDMSKFKWNEAQDNTSTLNQILNNTWDANKREIQAGVNESVDISGRGILIKDPNDPQRMLIAQHGILALSEDGGDTWKTAIRPDGISAEVIVGKLGVFAQVVADQIVVGDNGEQISDSVIASASTWDAKETPEGAQAKANTAETNAKNASVPKGVKFDDSVLIGNGNGIKVLDGNNIARVILGQYAAGKYGLKVTNGEIYATTFKSGTEGATNYVHIGSGFQPITVVENGNEALSIWTLGNGGAIQLYDTTYDDMRGQIYTMDDARGQGLRVQGRTSSGSFLPVNISGSSVEVDGMLYAHDGLTTLGSKSALIRTKSYGDRFLYAYEMPESKFGDDGVGELINGEARIELDPIFLETIEPHTDITPYIIHLTPYDYLNVKVKEIGVDYFIVEEQNGLNGKFAWELKATRINYKDVRLVEDNNDDVLTSNWEDSI